MPELGEPPVRVPLADRSVPEEGEGAPRPAEFAELYCRTNFSFLEGASHPDELAERAAALGYGALGVADVNSVAGVVRAHVAARRAGQKLIVGAEVTPEDAPPVVLLAMNRGGYGNLCRLLTVGRRRAGKGQCRLTFDDLADHASGLLAGIPLWPHVVSSEQIAAARPELARYRELFGDRAFALAALFHGPEDRLALGRMRELARRRRLPLVATNAPVMHGTGRRFLLAALRAIREGRPLRQLTGRLPANGERYLKSGNQMRALFRDCPQAVERTLEFAQRCTFRLDELRYEYPEELVPAGRTPIGHLSRLAWEGAGRRYPDGVPDKVRTLLGHELWLIEELHYEAYFLTVHDLVGFARSRGILCQGRGSAANSAVCYCLGVTSVDPGRHELLFERFISAERDEAPDIDIDFEHQRREEVLQYAYAKYGRARCGMTAEVITYRPKSAVRDLGKALGLSLDCVDRLAGSVERYGRGEDLAGRFAEAGLDARSRTGRQLLYLLDELLGFPRHLSQHVGGLVLCRNRLDEMVPIENAAMPHRTVIQWNKDDLEELGLLKVDCLCLGMLTAIKKCLELVKAHHGRELELATIPAEDPAVYRMTQRADTVGVFQIESRAQMAMLPRMKPACFYDLVIEVALVRPGPIQGDMVHPYLKRRAGQERVEYPDERIRAALERTLGVPIFQEQAMKLAQVAAGFSPGEADQLRRAMGAWRKRGVIDLFQEKLRRGMLDNGYSAEFAERLFQQIRGFGEYGFPESHAASFALLVYASCWLKHYYPAAFCAAIINSQPMGFYAPAQLVADARRHDVEVRPVDVNQSEWDCTLEGAGESSGTAVRLGFRLVRGLRRDHAETLIEQREAGGPYRSVEELARRTRLPRQTLAHLAKAAAFESRDLPRREAIWAALDAGEAAPLFDAHERTSAVPGLPRLSGSEEVAADYRGVGLSLRGHPVQFVRLWLDRRGVRRCGELASCRNGAFVKTAGLVLLRQRPSSAKGITFMTLEDESGQANLVVYPDVWERFRQPARGATALQVAGRVQHDQGGTTHLVAARLDDLSQELAVANRSHDFH